MFPQYKTLAPEQSSFSISSFSSMFREKHLVGSTKDFTSRNNNRLTDNEGHDSIQAEHSPAMGMTSRVNTRRDC